MNRFTAAGLVRDAAAGRRILVITMNATATHCALDDIVSAASSEMFSVRRANGQERIDFPAARGCITFRSYRQRGCRGFSADTVYIDAGVDPELRHPQDYADFAAVVATSPTGEIVRA